MFDKICYGFYCFVEWLVDKLLILLCVVFGLGLVSSPALVCYFLGFSWRFIFIIYCGFALIGLLYFIYDKGYDVFCEKRSRGDFKK